MREKKSAGDDRKILKCLGPMERITKARLNKRVHQCDVEGRKERNSLCLRRLDRLEKDVNGELAVTD